MLQFVGVKPNNIKGKPFKKIVRIVTAPVKGCGCGK